MPPSRISRTAPLRAIAFVAQFVVLDACTRGAHGLARHAGHVMAVVGALESLVLWSLLVALVEKRSSRALVALFAATVLVVDAFVYRYYGTLLDVQVAASAAHGWPDVRPIAMRLLPVTVALIGAVGAIEYALLARGTSRPLRALGASRRWRVGLALGLLLCLAFTPRTDLTPELRAVQACTALWAPHDAQAAGEVSIPVLPSSRAEVPSILLVLTESVRASSYCSDPRAPCIYSPETNALLPDRVPLRQMRSVASYTALSVAALLTGRPLVETGASHDPLGLAPTLFDYVRASRVDGRAPWVAYWSAQAASVLPRDVRGSVDSWITLETILGHGVEDEDDAVEQDMDRRLSERCVEEMPALPTPSFVMLHLLGTHAPYFIDPAHAPFQPTEQVITWAGLPRVANAYYDSIVAQDRALAACLRAFVAHQGGAPWLILFTSDHGEAFGEHGAIHHGQNLYDEQIHVPGWVAASNGALDAHQRESLARHADAFVTHLDVVPTVLDALGVLDGLAMAPLRSRLAGRSLLAPPAVGPPLPVTNCTTLFPCPLNTWGMLGDGQALVAQPWDSDWNCVELANGHERATGTACEALRDASRVFFPTLPGGQANAGR